MRPQGGRGGGGVPERPPGASSRRGDPAGARRPPLIGQRGLTGALGARGLAGGAVGLGVVTAARSTGLPRARGRGGRRARGARPLP